MASGAFGSGIWGFVVIGGFVVLGLALAYAMLRNRVTPRQERQTEEATRELYREQSTEDDARTP